MAKKPVRWLDSILDRVFSVIGAAAFSQIPEFMQQYVQRLGGHVDEAQRQVELIREAAQLSGKTLNAYVTKFLGHQDLDFKHQGEMLQGTIERAVQLRDALDAIQNADVFAKPFVFLAKMNYPIAKATLENFQPAVPLTLENLVYAFTGIFFALGLYHLSTKSPIRLINRVRTHRKAQRQRGMIA